jgi:hypothetical protein
VKVEMLTIYAGPDGRFDPGDVAEFDKPTATLLLEGGYAKPVDEEPAAAAPGETPYRRRSVADLREELGARGLESDGVKPELIERLEADDAAAAPDQEPAASGADDAQTQDD